MVCHYTNIIMFCLSNYMQLGKTALHKACEGARVDVVRILMRNGASIDQKDRVRLSYVCDHCVRENTLLCGNE